MRSIYKITPALALLGVGLTSVLSQEERQSEEDLNGSIVGLTPVIEPDGAVTYDLQGRFQSISIARINPNGDIEEACVSSDAEMQDFFSGADFQNDQDGAER